MLNVFGYICHTNVGIFTDGDFDAAVSVNSFNLRNPL